MDQSLLSRILQQLSAKRDRRSPSPPRTSALTPPDSLEQRAMMDGDPLATTLTPYSDPSTGSGDVATALIAPGDVATSGDTTSDNTTGVTDSPSSPATGDNNDVVAVDWVDDTSVVADMSTSPPPSTTETSPGTSETNSVSTDTPSTDSPSGEGFELLGESTQAGATTTESGNSTETNTSTSTTENDPGSTPTTPELPSALPPSGDSTTTSSETSPTTTPITPPGSSGIDPSSLVITNLALANDTGNPTDFITSDTTIVGHTAPNVVVQFDTNGDSVADYYTMSDADGNFTANPPGAYTPGQVTIQARASVWDSGTGEFVSGNWASLTFTYQTNTPPFIASFLCVELGAGIFRIQGTVYDDFNSATTMHFVGGPIDGMTCAINPDGTFSMTVDLSAATPGTYPVIARTQDNQGLWSNDRWDTLYIPPPPPMPTP